MSDSISTPVVLSIQYVRVPFRMRVMRVTSTLVIAMLLGGTLGSCLSAIINGPR